MAHIDENPLGPHLPLDPLPGHSSLGRLERVLRRGEFAVTTELNPPDSANPEDVYERAAVFDGWVDGINAVDASGANCHMSSVGICALLTRMGYAPIMQIACRDKNRIAIQGDVLGGAAMGVCNIMCLTGDGVQAGDQPGAKPVFDLDCMSLLETVRIMRDNSKFLSGRKLTTPPKVFLGAAINPFAPPYDFRPYRLAKKIEAGAQFVQSQYCFDVPMFREYMKKVRDLGLDEKCYILVGVGPMASAKTAKWIRSNVPGIHIPDSVIARLEGAQDQKKEGKQLCIDIINEVKEIEGVSGIHVMAYRQEEYVAEIVHDSGVLKGRQPWKREPNPVDQLVAERIERTRQGVEQNQQQMAETAAHHPH
ncbi:MULTISPECIES: methylenetetrahydrofolate reductase [unclassified Shinella]|uniref:methylenetetrahydrofolate reductase n=1 Tax=unclassified Shinella TaxID=2643062 RepID=UPI00225D8093|nr:MULTISPECIES: methylenetetrahydrofolate reductase [unclassified Shinella]MCO5138538.1 methylenetetrahydrofolate reductase [Shinella sp.]MDC7255375.1 methylenetetrahydrofolate reductase [Shinella sp. YE25]CAI0338156.1 5,10-methylenetetrahydrofolate reductase [Rhizobiaceae bacterium]CAK7256611.1 Methylenetetrahydrofolate reductase [Shinella sp. WSC3-e]